MISFRNSNVKTTIKEQINHYLMLIIGMAVMINVISLLFYSLNTSQYEAHMKQVLNLNQFYVNLSTGNIALGNYVQNGADSNYQQFFESMETAESLLASLEYERISQSFLRDIQDMRAMLSTYRKNGVQIRNYILEWGTKSNSSNALKGVLDLYDNASEIYSEMDGENSKTFILNCWNIPIQKCARWNTAKSSILQNCSLSFW